MECVSFWLSHTFGPKGKDMQASKRRRKPPRQFALIKQDNAICFTLSLVSFACTYTRSHMHETHMADTHTHTHHSFTFLMYCVCCGDAGSSGPCCPLEVTGESCLSILGDRSSISHSNVTFNYLQRWSGLIRIQKSILHGHCCSLLLRPLLQNFCVHVSVTENKLRRRRSNSHPLFYEMASIKVNGL